MIDAAVRTIRRPALETQDPLAAPATSGTPASKEYLGPAEVLETHPDRVVVAFPEGSTADVELAFAMPYTPAVGDVLLVIGRGPRNYAIGVLHGAGRTAFAIQGDVDLRAVNGKLSLSGDRGVEIRGPEVDVYTTALRMVARDVTQKFESLLQRVTGMLRLHAGESQTIVDGSSVAQSKRAAILTQETVTINGREVHLG